MDRAISKTLWVGDEEHGMTVTIRQIIPAEAAEVVKMVKRAFGDVFGFYKDEEIIKLNQNGSLFSLVAVTEDGDLAGHLDLEFFNESNIALMDNACTPEKYSHTHIVFELAKFIIDYAKNFNIEGVLSLSLTNHTIFQRVANHFGSDCGLLLGSVPIKDPSCKQLQSHYIDSTVVNFIPFRPKPLVKLYIPEHHQNLIEQIYTMLGYPFIACHVEQLSPPSTDGIVELINENMGVVILYVVDYGHDTLAQIELELKYIFGEEKQVAAYIYLNLEDPYTPHFVKMFEKMGFIFSGILPFGGKGRDVIILQYLNSTVDLDKIAAFSPMSKEILAHIRSCKAFW
ncbi:MAG: hypothetical protein ACM3UZ_07565 [Acidobacteriota bacterium]